jgi:hypothetical protein
MRKSDIVVAVVIHRSAKPPAEKQILKDLSEVVKHLSLDTETWDHDVETVIGNGIIKHIGSVTGELTLQDLVLDIDLILKRIS